MKKYRKLMAVVATMIAATMGSMASQVYYTILHALDEETKERINGLRAVHRHHVDYMNPSEPATHPIAVTHPETGRKSLYVNPHFSRYIEGLPGVESRELLNRLLDHVVEPRFIWTHEWQVGDLVMWDNRPTQHRRESFPPTERRILKRTQIFNDEILEE